MLLTLLVACAPEETTPKEAAPTASFARIDAGNVGTKSQEALARMPRWLKPDLALALTGLSPERQDEIADTILSLDDPYLLDEVGFAFAHLSPEVLSSDSFYPELVIENARMVYEVDPLLNYVALVETGTPGVDADWTTTTRYRVEVEGEIQEIELDPDLYYWFIVHPRIEDEVPAYIDAWSECGKQTLECPTTPEKGAFWRSFLWETAAETCPEGDACPVVPEYLGDTDVLWGNPDGKDAVHNIATMMLASPGETGRWFSFGAYGERSVQPNRIYTLGRGNCGEWADMTTAIARTALIPNVNVTPSSWDHTWNAFYLDRWVAYEPVNWWFDYGYSSGYVTYATRGDTSVWYQTEQYTENTATLEIEVQDAQGVPVDGASVVLWSPYDTSYWYAGEQVTNSAGVASFQVGADKELGYVVLDALGEYPGDGYLDRATSGISVGGVDRVVAKLGGSVVAPFVPEVVPANGNIPLSIRVTSEGRLSGLSYRLGATSRQPVDSPALSVYVLDASNYAAFAAGQSFSALEGDLSAGVYYVLVENGSSQGTAAVGTVELGVADQVWEEPFGLEPGGSMVVEVVISG